MGNWITEFNKVERQAYDMTYKLGEELEQIYNECYGELYDICVDTLIATKYNNKKFDSLDDKFQYLMEKYSKVAEINKSNSRFNKLVTNTVKALESNRDAVDSLIVNNIVYRCMNINENMFMKRRKVLKMRLTMQLDAYQKLFLNALQVLENEAKAELNEYVFDFIEKYKNKKLDEIRELENLTIEKCKYIKIFDYKKMCKLAIEKGFKPKRTTGDHLMYEHEKTKQLVPIPAHELGYGLMLEIQKELNEKSVA
ncbi:type II toxin-antitoxin system HicA family toxin [Clostridium perfringens]|uniref:type II toxin-antitoxin system HicA family toxin n=2 Tax=Clostridium perfringens TaxID=1502 RepID=UPI0013E3B74D|nr:type II toxin-antitoxin system HicA family toxin [Clostridium perfringens]MCR1963972.1 type II toxin-antitoxin system HicA family toxin [Clostridium perfringens]MDK0543581.1 type II toxin-antitoxin system HicA family toxin [Clostridium perfringens]MDK0646959.1 type II toxin-antitoxin system HicA family toxin [Clostridium perfringens]MDK0827707.1 type II toxin-antitoxin system HicA family toxin [Clostridium perfringens]MDM0778665.1 type II toxin-antitoxin system HicA family toxin [Clostridiu